MKSGLTDLKKKTLHFSRETCRQNRLHVAVCTLEYALSYGGHVHVCACPRKRPVYLSICSVDTGTCSSEEEDVGFGLFFCAWVVLGNVRDLYGRDFEVSSREKKQTRNTPNRICPAVQRDDQEK